MARRTNTNFRNPDLASSIADLGEAFIGFKTAAPRNQLLRERGQLENQLLRQSVAKGTGAEEQRKARIAANQLLSTGIGDLFTDPAQTEVTVETPQLDTLSAQPIIDRFSAAPTGTPTRAATPVTLGETVAPQAPITETLSQIDLPSIKKGIFDLANQRIKTAADPTKALADINAALEVARLSPNPEIRKLAPSLKAAAAKTATAEAESRRKIKVKDAEQRGDFLAKSRLKRQDGLQAIALEGEKARLKRLEGKEVTTIDTEKFIEISEQALDGFGFTEAVRNQVVAETERLRRTENIGSMEAFQEAVRTITKIDPSILGDDDLVLTDDRQVRMLRDGTPFIDAQGNQMVRTTQTVNGKKVAGKVTPQQFAKDKGLKQPPTGGPAAPTPSTIPPEIQSFLEFTKGGAGVPALDDPSAGIQDVALQPILDFFTGRGTTERRLRDEESQQQFETSQSGALTDLQTQAQAQIQSILASDLPEAEKRENIGDIFNTVLRDLERIQVIDSTALGGAGRSALSLTTDINRALVQTPGLLPSGATETAGGLPITPEGVDFINQLFQEASQQGFLAPAR